MTAGMERRAEAIAAKAYLADRNRKDRRQAAWDAKPMVAVSKALDGLLVGTAWRTTCVDGTWICGQEKRSERTFCVSRRGKRFTFEISPNGHQWDDAPTRLGATDPEGIANEVAAILQHNDGGEA